MAERSLAVVADLLRRTAAISHRRPRATGLAFQASDVAWSASHGPLVVGPLLSIVMALAGRPATLADLTGDGPTTLARRIPPG